MKKSHVVLLLVKAAILALTVLLHQYIALFFVFFFGWMLDLLAGYIAVILTTLMAALSLLITVIRCFRDSGKARILDKTLLTISIVLLPLPLGFEMLMFLLFFACEM